MNNKRKRTQHNTEESSNFSFIFFIVAFSMTPRSKIEPFIMNVYYGITKIMLYSVIFFFFNTIIITCNTYLNATFEQLL